MAKLSSQIRPQNLDIEEVAEIFELREKVIRLYLVKKIQISLPFFLVIPTMKLFKNEIFIFLRLKKMLV